MIQASNLIHWPFAIMVGLVFNITLFMFIPLLGQRSVPEPEIIIVDFLPWQQVKKNPEEKPPAKKPSPLPKVKPKLKAPKPKLIETEKKQVPLKKTVPVEQKKVDKTPPLPTPVPVHKLSSKPRFIHQHKPIYPMKMRNMGKQATVKLDVLIDIDGLIKSITVFQSAGPDFDQAAINAAEKSTFSPAKKNGRPVPVIWRFPVRFVLR